MKRVKFLMKNAAIAACTVMVFSLFPGCEKEKENHVVTFESNGGSAVTSQTVKEGEKATRPEDPSKTNATFDTWYREESRENPWAFRTGVVTGDMTLYAGWLYEVKFDADGGSLVESQTIKHGEKVIQPDDPTRPNLKFVAWYKEIGLLNEWNFDDDLVTGATTLYAGWAPFGTFVVTFDTNGGSSVQYQTVIEGRKVIKPNDPVKEGYKLVAWYSDADLQNEWDFDNDVVTAAMKLYADWIWNEHVVTFESGVGILSTAETVVLNDGAKVTEPANPSLSNNLVLTFDAWYTEATFENVWNFNNPVTKDMTLYAKWIDNIEMVHVGIGIFTMARGATNTTWQSEEHTVVITEDFSIGKYPVTQSQWAAVMGIDNVGDFLDDRQKAHAGGGSIRGVGDDYPIYYVSYQDAHEFISKLNAATGKNFRLPTEAEWEFAARGGNGKDGFEFPGSNTVDDIAWHGGNSGGATHPVGEKDPNEIGIYDMLGNVWECTEGEWGYIGPGPRIDPQGPTTVITPNSCVVRGVNWSSGSNVNLLRRENSSLNSRTEATGFRLAD